MCSNSFKLLLAGQIVTLFGSALLRFVLSLYVLDITGRADIFAMLFAISTMPLLLSPIGGAIADRVNRRNMMVAIDFINGAVVLGFILILYFGDLSVFMIGACMVLLGFTGAMESPTVLACVPAVAPAEKLEQANGIIQGIGSLAQTVAPILGGVLYGIFGMKPLVIFGCAAFFTASFIEIFIRMPFEKRPHEGRIIPMILGDTKEGFIYTIHKPLIRKCVFLAAALNLFLSPYFIVGIPVILRITMDSPDTLYGIGMGIVEVGTILGALSIGLFAKRMQMNTLYRWIVWIAVLLIPVAILLSPIAKGLGFYSVFVLFFFFIIPMVMVTIIVSIFVITHVQRETPNALLGKVMAIIMMVSQCAAPIGQLIYGAVLEKFSSEMFIPTGMLVIVTLAIAVVGKIALKDEGNKN